jgi:hypothetical protein
MNDGVARASLSPHDESAEADLRQRTSQSGHTRCHDHHE